MLKLDHSLQNPNQFRSIQCCSPSGGFVGVEVGVGDGSTQISPNQAEDVQEWLLVVVAPVDVGIGGAEVMG